MAAFIKDLAIAGIVVVLTFGNGSEFRMWATLNDEGKKVWGDVFPDGKVPVMSMSFHEAKVGPNTKRVVLVSWNVLSKLQKYAVLTKISEKSGVSEEVILKDIEKIGLPLRESLTTGIIAAELRYFI